MTTSRLHVLQARASRPRLLYIVPLGHRPVLCTCMGVARPTCSTTITTTIITSTDPLKESYSIISINGREESAFSSLSLTTVLYSMIPSVHRHSALVFLHSSSSARFSSCSYGLVGRLSIDRSCSLLAEQAALGFTWLYMASISPACCNWWKDGNVRCRSRSNSSRRMCTYITTHPHNISFTRTDAGKLYGIHQTCMII